MFFGETTKGPTFEHGHGDLSIQEVIDLMSEGMEGEGMRRHRNHEAEIGDDWTLKF